MNTQIDSAMRAGRAYWFVDGFTEMLGGGLFVLLGGVLLLRGMSPQGSFLAQLLSIAGDIGLIKISGIVAAGLLIWWLKDRFTYPRSGFARTRRLSWVTMLTFLRNAALCLLLPVLGLAAAITLLPGMRTVLFSMPVWSPVAMGLLWALLCILAGIWLGLRRFMLLGGLILLAGITISVWQLSLGLAPIPVELQSISLAAMPEALIESLNRTFMGIGLLSLVFGVFFVISGLLTFLRYRRENPLPSEEQA